MKTMQSTFNVCLLFSLLCLTIVVDKQQTKIKTIEVGLIKSIQLPSDHWICTDVLRNVDGVAKCKTWENIHEH